MSARRVRLVSAGALTGSLLLLPLSLAAPAAAAPPRMHVDPVDAELEGLLVELFSQACDVPVSVEGTGKIMTKTFFGRDGGIVREQVTYVTRFEVTNTETGQTYTIHDVGPDRFLYEDGELVTHQLIGRSTTGSGTIGRTVLDLSGDQPVEVSRSGKRFGDFITNTCEAIT